MKFEERFKKKVVQAWKNKYVRYDILTMHLNTLKCLYQENNISMEHEHKSLNPSDIPSKIKLNSSLTQNNSLTSPHPMLKNMDSLYSTISLIDNDNDNDNDTPTIANKNSIYQFNHVTTVMQPDLSSKIPVFDPTLSKIQAKEQEFVVLLEQDLITVSNFYAQQCRYFATQHNALIIRVELMVKKQQQIQQNIHCKSSNNDDDEDADDDDEYNEDEETTMKDIEKEKEYLRLLFRQIYNAVRMLEEYRKINEIAFYKIIKMHHKISAIFRNLAQETTKLIKNESNFGNDNFIIFLEHRLESLYSNYLRSKGQTTTEAVERIRQPPSDKTIQIESFIIGLCGGGSFDVLLVCGVLVATLQHHFWDSQETYRSWYIFRASMILSVYLWLWGGDVWIFEKYGFNHAFIFGADPTTLKRVPDIWNIAAVFTVTAMIFTLLYVTAFLFPDFFNINPEIFTILGLCCWILYAFIPFPCVRHTKRFLIKSFCKQIISPFSTVEFIDFFLADQWTSLFTIVFDLSFSFCHLFTGAFLLDGTQQSPQCDNKTTNAGLVFLKLVPYWIRFWQCIRRAWDRKKANKKITPKPTKNDLCAIYWHIANAGKYSCSIIVVLINVFHVYYQSKATRALSVSFGVITTTYSYFWDIYKDWGLIRWNENKQHKLLRKEITFPAVVYYIAMIIDFIFRIAWAVSLYPASFGIYAPRLIHYIKLPLSIAEITRRCMWNVFRIENEHLNNCGEFRVVKDVPIAQNYENAIKLHNNNQSSIHLLKTKTLQRLTSKSSGKLKQGNLYDDLADNDDDDNDDNDNNEEYNNGEFDKFHVIEENEKKQSEKSVDNVKSMKIASENKETLDS